MTLGRAIFHIRKEKGIHQGVIADQIGVSQAYLSTIENDKKVPTIQVLEKIAKALDTPIQFLFFLTLSESQVPPGKRNAFRLVYPHLVDIISTLIYEEPNTED